MVHVINVVHQLISVYGNMKMNLHNVLSQIVFKSFESECRGFQFITFLISGAIFKLR